jgi:hypothetical protein
MNLPGFNADASIGSRAMPEVASGSKTRRDRRGSSQTGVLQLRRDSRCARKRGRPRAVCNACGGQLLFGRGESGGHCRCDGVRNRVVCDV